MRSAPLFSRSSLSVCLLLAMALPLDAAFVPLGTAGDDPNNYATFSGAELQSITLNGVSYASSDLTNVRLTEYAASSALVLLTADQADVNPSAAERRAFLEADWSGETGLVNPARVDAEFAVPVSNLPGADMVLFEIGSGDAFDLTINGQTLNVVSANYGDAGAETDSADILDTLDSTTPASLTALLTKETKLSSNSAIKQAVVGVGIDFSDFGVAANALVDGFSISAGGLDPVIIAGVVGVPEPGALLLLVCGVASAVTWRRR